MKTKSYFSYFPRVDFNGKSVVDLTRRAAFINDIKEDQRLVGHYKVKSGETPWGLAHDFYGSEEYDWIILSLNDIVNPFFDWCLSQVELERLINLKYGESRYDIHHWLLNDRVYYEDPENPLSVFVTNQEYEEIENEKKRIIKILRPNYLNNVVSAFDSTMRGVKR